MSLVLADRGHRILFHYTGRSHGNIPSNLRHDKPVRYLQRLGNERGMDLGSRDCPGSKKNNFTRKTTLRHKERNNNGSRTDNVIFNSVNNSGSGLCSANNQITSRSKAMQKKTQPSLCCDQLRCGLQMFLIASGFMHASGPFNEHSEPLHTNNPCALLSNCCCC